MSPGSSPFDAFLAAFRADLEAGAIKPLAEHLARFPGDDKRFEFHGAEHDPGSRQGHLTLGG